MRIFVSFNDPVPCDRVCRLNTNSFTSSTELIQEISTLCRVKRKWLIVKLKTEIINVHFLINIVAHLRVMAIINLPSEKRVMGPSRNYA